MANIYVALCVCIYLYMANAEECPDGMQKRGDNCCKPVKCEPNEDYRLCNDTHGEDVCIPCPPKTSNPYAINTSLTIYQKQQPNICKNTTEICLKTACPEEAKVENLTKCLETGNFECMCNLDNGFYGHDPKICQKWSGNVTELQRGFVLTQDGHVEECKQGYVKDKVGYGSCRPHRKCQDDEKIISNGNSTTDTQCGPLTQSTVSPDVNSTDGTPRSKGGMKDQVKIGVIVGCTVLVAIGLAVIIWLVRNRRGRNTGRNDDNPETGRML